MPRISHFHGIAIYMYYRDHAPPHFHAIYGEFEASIEIASATLIDGQIPPKASLLVREWTGAATARADGGLELGAGGPTTFADSAAIMNLEVLQ